MVTADEVTPFAVELRRAIERSGGELTNTSAEADTVVRIQRDRSGRRVLSVSARNTPQEYEIFYSVEYSVDRGGKEVLETQPLEMIRNLSFDETQLLAKDREEAIMREAMAKRPRHAGHAPARIALTRIDPGCHRAKRSVADTSSCVLPASSAEWPASGTTRKSASGQASCRSHALRIGQTTS